MIASEDNPADEPPRSKRYRPRRMLTKCGTFAPWAAADSELFAVLSLEAARVASAEATTRKQSKNRSNTGLTCQGRGRMGSCSSSTSAKRSRTDQSACGSCKSGKPALPLWRLVLPRAESGHCRHGPASHRSPRRVHKLGRVLDSYSQVRWLDSRLCRSTESNASAERVSSISSRKVSGATAMGSRGCNDGNDHGGER